MGYLRIGLLEFEWDDDKANANLAKHGISFSEAASVFRDPLAIILDDPAHSFDEERSILVGISEVRRTLVVVSVSRDERHRIISARTATPKSGGSMSDVTSKAKWEDEFEMEAEYDFSRGRLNPYAKLAGATRVVELEEDVHIVFPDSRSVNEALRLLIKTAQSANYLPKAS